MMVAVGMVFEGQSAEGFSDLFLRRFSRYAQQAVIVFLQRHGDTRFTGDSLISS